MYQIEPLDCSFFQQKLFSYSLRIKPSKITGNSHTYFRSVRPYFPRYAEEDERMFVFFDAPGAYLWEKTYSLWNWRSCPCRLKSSLHFYPVMILITLLLS